MMPGDEVILLPYPDDEADRWSWIRYGSHTFNRLGRAVYVGGKSIPGCLRVSPTLGSGVVAHTFDGTFGWPMDYVRSSGLGCYEVSW